MNRSGDWLGHALRNAPWRLQRQAAALGALSIFVAIIIGALYLAYSASVSTLGRQLETLIIERNRLEQTNEQFRSEIAQLRSVPRLLARAQELGFSPATRQEIEYLLIDGYNPNRAQVIAQAQPEQAPLAVYDESFTGWLQQQWDSLTGQFRQFTNGEG